MQNKPQKYFNYLIIKIFINPMKNWDTLMNYERVRIENNRIRGKFLENC